MWDWIIENSIIIVIVSAAVSLALLIFNQTFRNKLTPSGSSKRQERLATFISWAYWVVEMVAVVFLVSSFIALVYFTGEDSEGIPGTEIANWLKTNGLRIIVIIFVTAVFWMVARQFIPPLVDRIMARPQIGESREGRKRRAETLKRVFLALVRVVIILVAFIIVLTEMNIEIGPILAGLGVVGIAVGFGAQYLVKDLIAGIFVLMENQYRVGDVASVAGVIGTVEEVGLRKTVLRDLDGVVHHVPNGEIRIASNYSRHFARVNLDISVSYGTELDYAIEVLNQVCRTMAEDKEWKSLFRTVPQVLRVEKLGDSGIDIKIVGEVKPLEQWKIMGELRKRIKTEFDKAGIEIPWPHTKVYFGEETGNGATDDYKPGNRKDIPSKKILKKDMPDNDTTGADKLSS